MNIDPVIIIQLVNLFLIVLWLALGCCAVYRANKSQQGRLFLLISLLAVLLIPIFGSLCVLYVLRNCKVSTTACPAEQNSREGQKASKAEDTDSP